MCHVQTFVEGISHLSYGEIVWLRVMTTYYHTKYDTDYVPEM